MSAPYLIGDIETLNSYLQVVHPGWRIAEIVWDKSLEPWQ